MVPRQSPVYRFHSSKSRESNTDTRSFLFALEVALYKASTIWEERGIHVPGKVIPANPVHVFYQIVLLQLSFSYLFYHTAELQIKEPYYNLFEATITSAGCNIIAPAAAGGGEIHASSKHSYIFARTFAISSRLNILPEADFGTLLTNVTLLSLLNGAT